MWRTGYEIKLRENKKQSSMTQIEVYKSTPCLLQGTHSNINNDRMWSYLPTE